MIFPQDFRGSSWWSFILLATFVNVRISVSPLAGYRQRDGPAEHLDRVSNDHEVLEVTRQGERSVVIIDEGEYESLIETLHLLRGSKNAKGLMQSSPTPTPTRSLSSIRPRDEG